METITVVYVGPEPWLYGDRRIEPGDTVDLPAEEVRSWGENVPPAFEKQ